MMKRLISAVLCICLYLVSFTVYASNDNIKISADAYMDGGEGVGYHDRTPGVDNNYFSSRNDDVEMVSQRGYNAVVMTSGEWLKYKINIPESGNYKLYMQYVSPLTNNKMSVSINAGGEKESILEPSASSGWSTNITREIGTYAFRAGENIICVKCVSGSWFLYDFELEYTGKFSTAVSENGAEIDALTFSSTDGSADNNVLLLAETQSAEYILDVKSGGYYRICINGMSDAENTAALLLDGNAVIERKYDAVGTKPKIFSMGNICLSAGEHVLALKSATGALRLNSIILKPLVLDNPLVPDNDGYSVTVNFKDYMPGGEGVGYHDTTTGVDDAAMEDRGDDVEVYPSGSVFCRVTEWLKYMVDVPQSGSYMLTFYSSAPAGTNQKYRITAGEDERIFSFSAGSGGWNRMELNTLGVIRLSEGQNEVKIENAGDAGENGNLMSFTLEHIDDYFEIYGITAGDSLIFANTRIPRGTDTINVYFTSEPDKAYIDKIRLKNSGADVDFDAEMSGNRVTLKLKETLGYNTEYTLDVSEVKNQNGTEIYTGGTAVMTTGDESTDSGTGYLRIDSFSIKGNTVKISGAVLSSSKTGIKGRRVVISENGTELSSAISGENGVFGSEFSMPDNAGEGMHSFGVCAEYMNTAEVVSGIYLPSETEQRALSALRQTADANDVKQFAEDYAELLGLELPALGNNSLFYEKLIGYSAADIDSLVQYYNTCLTLEKINQADSAAAVGTIFENEDMELFDINKEKTEYISDYKDELYTRIYESERFETKEDFETACERAANSIICVMNNIGKAALTAEFSNVYRGQSADISLNLDKNYDDVKAARYIITCSAAETLKNAAADLNKEYVIEKNYNSDSLVIIVSGKNGVKTNDVGKLCMPLSGSTARADFAVYAEVIYDKNLSFDVISLTDTVSGTVNVVENKNNISGSGGSGSGGGKPSGTITNPIDVKSSGEDEEGEFVFTDLNSAEWAAESVVYLYKRGIIAKSDDMKFRPDDKVTRAEFIKMLVMALGCYDKNAVSEFNDVAADKWYYPYVSSAYRYGIAAGNETGNYEPDENISRQDMCAVVSRALTKMGYTREENTETFADDEYIAGYAKDGVYMLRDMQIISGMGGNLFEPSTGVSRAMAARVIHRLTEEVLR